MTDAPLYCTLLLCDSVYNHGGNAEGGWWASQFVFIVVVALLIFLVATVEIGRRPK